MFLSDAASSYIAIAKYCNVVCCMAAHVSYNILYRYIRRSLLYTIDTIHWTLYNMYCILLARLCILRYMRRVVNEHN